MTLARDLLIDQKLANSIYRIHTTQSVDEFENDKNRKYTKS